MINFFVQLRTMSLYEWIYLFHVFSDCVFHQSSVFCDCICQKIEYIELVRICNQTGTLKKIYALFQREQCSW